MFSIKNQKIEIVKNWINKITKTDYGKYKLQKYNGDELDKMTVKQIQMILDYCNAAYHIGVRDGVEWARTNDKTKAESASRRA